MNEDSRVKKLKASLKQQTLSVSHDFDHLNRVLDFARQLAKVYLADWKILEPAVLLHDLARQDTKLHGKASAQAGARQAIDLLAKTGYLADEIKLITQCIAEHDQPDLHSKLLEARILKDADFLDGFGARGILRSLIYSGETGEGIAGALCRLREKMPRRIEGLEFIESQRLAWQEYRLVELVSSQLDLKPDLAAASYPGKLIVLDGISGCGKDTQAELLAEFLVTSGQKVLVINHPTAFFKQIWHLWRTEVNSPVSEGLLLAADRYRMTKETILPALRSGTWVISSRAGLDAQVYQQSSEIEAEFWRWLFSFEPVADLLIYLNLKPEIAWQRKQQRKEVAKSFFLDSQTRQYKLYPKVLAHYPNVVNIEADGSKEAVFDKIKACIKEFFSLE